MSIEESARITILLVDDHALFRKGLSALISQNDAMEVLAEAGSGEEALRLLGSLAPDIVLMDIDLPGISGIETMHRMCIMGCSAKSIVLSATDFDDQLLACMDAGAAGYLIKNLEPDDLFNTIEAVYKSGLHITKVHLEQIMSALKNRTSSDIDGEKEVLSLREREVIIYVALGLTNKEIAEKLTITSNTIKAHISNIMVKLNLHNRVELASYAIATGLVRLK